jgi:hypothetical protein
MKNLIYTLFALFITVSGFSQEKTAFTSSLEKLMNAKNGSAIFTRILDSNIDNVAPAKQAEFRQKINAAAEEAKANAIKYFTKKYSQDDINEIYTEFTTEGRIDYTQKTLTFIREWRNFKGQFQKRFKEIYQTL